MAKQTDATARFEKRWTQAVEQPELIEAPAMQLDVDLSPAGVLSRMRELDRAALGLSADAVEDTLKRLRDRFR
ncbi:MAG: hypothetical protein ACREJ0_24525 [Geminicoccaceae bacterium]